MFLPEPTALGLIESCQAISSMTSLTARSLASLQFLYPSSSSFPDLLQGNSGRHPPSNRQNQQFQQKTDFVVRGQIRYTVVDSQCTPVELASISLVFPISHHDNRCCEKRGMEGIMQETENSGQVDSRGGFSLHKHFRAKGSPFCSEIVCKSLSNDKCSCEVQNRQHPCSSLHQSLRENKVCAGGGQLPVKAKYTCASPVYRYNR